MTKIYYIQNEKQYRKLLVGFLEDGNFEVDRLEDIGIYGCSYYEGGRCDDYECEGCILFEHLEDKNVKENIDIDEENLIFPAILVIADTYYKEENFTLIPVSEAKENTKYGECN